MKAQALATQDHGETARYTIKQIVEECEMKATNAITTLNNWLSQGWVRKTPGKVLAALAVGGLIIGAVVTPSSASADEPGRPLSIEVSQGYGPIDDMATAALLGTNLDTRLYNNGMSFVEETGVGKGSYTQGADVGPFLSALFSAAELSSIMAGGYTQGADVGPFLSALFSAAELSSIMAGDYTQGADAGPFLSALFSAAELSSIIAGDYTQGADVGPFLSALFSAAELSSIMAADDTFWADFPN